MRIGKYEIAFGIKEFLIVSIAFFAAFGTILFYVSFFGGPSYPSLSSISRFDRLSGAAVLATPQTFSTTNCDIFVSGPDRQIKYFDTVLCENLDKTTVTPEQLLDFGDGQTGAYTILIYSEETGEGTSFSFVVE